MKEVKEFIKKCRFCKKEVAGDMVKVRGRFRCEECFKSGWRIDAGLSKIDLIIYSVVIFLLISVSISYYFL